MWKKSVLALTVLCVCAVRADADMLTFDDLYLGDYGDSLTYGDVQIQTYTGSHLQITNQSADGMGNAHSSPNKLSVWGNQPWVPKEKTSFVLLFGHPVTEVGFWLTGTFHDTTVNAFDYDANLLETFVQTYPCVGPLAPDGTPWDYYYDRELRFISIGASAISTLSIQPSAYDSFSIDDVSYNVVPAPGALLLGSIGVGLVGWLKRRRVL